MNRGSVSLMSFVCLLLVGCLGSHETIRDIQRLRQDHNAYLDGTVYHVLMRPDVQQQRDEDYNRRFFSPWHQNHPRSGVADMLVEFDKFEQNLGWAKNGRRHTKTWMEQLKHNARLQEYSGNGHAAITIRPSDLRSLPSEKPHFDRVGQALSGYPFDNLQATAVMANTPVFVSHVSRDKDWFWVETGYYFGWMRAQDVAYLPPGFMEKWETGRYAVIVRDKTAICDAEGLFLFRASLGTIFPLRNTSERGVEIVVAVADQDRRAMLKQVKLSKDIAAAKPLPLTTAHMARLANELMNEPYGWGGLYGNRDCSAMTRDLFAPFGVWLPRNSGDQAREGGRFVDLSTLGASEKERRIISEGIPYLTLLWRKGHIMLYVGTHDGEPLVFHNLWGISTRTVLGGKGKVIVGHAAITTLHPGRERPCYDESSDLAANLMGMTFLAEWPEIRMPAGR